MVRKLLVAVATLFVIVHALPSGSSSNDPASSYDSIVQDAAAKCKPSTEQLQTFNKKVFDSSDPAVYVRWPIIETI